MTSIYPKEENSNGPPTYEQATYYPQAPPIPSYFGMYPTSSTLPPSKELPVDMYPISATNMPPQGPPVGTHMFITTQALLYGDLPVQCICPHCHQPIVTRVEKKTGVVTWLVCSGVFLVGGWLGCCLIPFCVDGLKDTEHYCPFCAILLGSRRRI